MADTDLGEKPAICPPQCLTNDGERRCTSQAFNRSQYELPQGTVTLLFTDIECYSEILVRRWQNTTGLHLCAAARCPDRGTTPARRAHRDTIRVTWARTGDEGTAHAAD